MSLQTNTKNTQKSPLKEVPVITLCVTIVMLVGFFHKKKYGKSSHPTWWLKLIAFWFLGSALAVGAVGMSDGIMLMLIPVLLPLVIGLFLKEISSVARNGFAPRKPEGGIVIAGIALWSLFNCIPTSLSPLIGIVVFIFYTLPIGMVIGGIILAMEEPPKPTPHGPPHPHCHTPG